MIKFVGEVAICFVNHPLGGDGERTLFGLVKGDHPYLVQLVQHRLRQRLDAGFD
jgi:hypothetical protein